MPALTPGDWALAAVGALGIGLTKAGFSGMSLVHVLLFAIVFGARDSTGVILPMLVAGDVFALRAFWPHTQWVYVRRMLPATCIGVAIGALLMGRIEERLFEPIIGWIILVLTVLQVLRMLRPDALAHVPHSRPFAWTMGLAAGVTTMMANAAGPIYTLYALAVSLPKLALVGTGAGFFFLVNLVKLPFSVALGLIRFETLLVNAVLLPVILAGIVAGRWLTEVVPQRLFDGMLLTFATAAALKLIGAF